LKCHPEKAKQKFYIPCPVGIPRDKQRIPHNRKAVKLIYILMCRWQDVDCYLDIHLKKEYYHISILVREKEKPVWAGQDKNAALDFIKENGFVFSFFFCI